MEVRTKSRTRDQGQKCGLGEEERAERTTENHEKNQETGGEPGMTWRSVN